MGTPRVLIIGAGNAALCAAISAAEHGAQVTMLERAPLSLSGGNSRFTAGAMRVVYNGIEDLRALIPDLSLSEIDSTDFGAYSRDAFFDDLGAHHPISHRSGVSRHPHRPKPPHVAVASRARSEVFAAVRSPVI